MNNSNFQDSTSRRDFLVSTLALTSIAASVSANAASFAMPVTANSTSNSCDVTIYGRRFRLHGFWIDPITAASDLQRVAVSSMFDTADFDAMWPVAMRYVCDLAVSVCWLAGNDDLTSKCERLRKHRAQSKSFKARSILVAVAFGGSIDLHKCADVAASIRLDETAIDRSLLIPVVDEFLSPSIVRVTTYMCAT